MNECPQYALSWVPRHARGGIHLRMWELAFLLFCAALDGAAVMLCALDATSHYRP